MLILLTSDNISTRCSTLFIHILALYHIYKKFTPIEQESAVRRCSNQGATIVALCNQVQIHQYECMYLPSSLYALIDSIS